MRAKALHVPLNVDRCAAENVSEDSPEGNVRRRARRLTCPTQTIAQQ
jgi:hypothetical protein